MTTVPAGYRETLVFRSGGLIMRKYSDSLLSYDHTKNDTPEDDSLGIKTYGIDISDSAVLKSLNAFHEDEKTYLCIGLNSNTSDVVLSFIDWIAP